MKAEDIYSDNTTVHDSWRQSPKEFFSIHLLTISASSAGLHNFFLLPTHYVNC